VPHDFVALLDDSASLSGPVLTRAATVLDAQPSVGTVFIATQTALDGVEPGHRWLRLAATLGPDTVGSRCAVMRRAIFEAAGQHGLATRRGELALWLRAAALADVAYQAGPVRLVSVSAPRASVVRVGEVTELHERAHAFRELFDGFAPLRDQARLRTAAYRALARSARERARVAAHGGDAIEASLCRHLARDVDRWRRQG
jgi:hypothetical protein